ncbi:MAG: transporter permease [Planctomycetota bacterium]|nr:MAG: transporter permease [Planctomycetota bacterium]
MKAKLQSERRHFGLYLYAALALLSLLIFPFVGAEDLCLRTIWSDLSQGRVSQVDTEIFVSLRLPRVLLAFLTGAVLAVCGNAFQVILRNPLATPYTLGVTGGAAVGAYLAIAFPALNLSLGTVTTVQFMAMAGSALIVFLIYVASRKRTGISTHTMLLAGVTISIICGALILLIRYLTKPGLLVSLDRWTMGQLDTVGFESLYAVAALSLLGLLFIALSARGLNHISLGEDLAMGHGVDVARVQKLCFIGGSLATASVVSVAGPIGFIGLIVPHAVRKISGFHNQRVLLGCFFVGGAFLVICDAVARTLLAPSEIPVGVISALIGGPCFVYVLLKLH